MTQGYLIGRVPLRFSGHDSAARLGELSAIAFDGDGNLWAAPDEGAAVERLSPRKGGDYVASKPIPLTGALHLPKSTKTEIDIEGLDVHGDALWLTGSHTSTRQKAARKNGRLDPARLAAVSAKPDRYVVTRVPLQDGEVTGPVAHLPYTETGNSLMDALVEDPHFGPFLKFFKAKGNSLPLASKENGFDIEGLAVRGKRIFLGLRGPVLRGWAALLEIQPDWDDSEPKGDKARSGLSLVPVGRKKRLYRKHFLKLDGMGLRDLTWQDDRLLLLAGPTMDITGRQSLWALDATVFAGEGDTITEFDGKTLRSLFDLPEVIRADKAEGLAYYDGLGEPGVMIAYDSPSGMRQPDDCSVYADVFRLPPN